MGCKASSDKKGEADYDQFAHDAKEGQTVASEIKAEIKGEKKALSAETEDQLFEIYGVGVTVVAQTLLHVMRGEVDAAKSLVASAGAREVAPGHDVRKRDVHPDMLAGVVELLSLEETVAELKAKNTPQIEVENAIRSATACWLLGQGEVACPKTPQHLFERYTIERYFDDPEGLTELSVLEQVGLKGHNRHLTACPTAVYHKLHNELCTRTLASLKQLQGNLSEIQECDQVSIEVLALVLEREIAYHTTYHKHVYAIDQMSGCHSGLLMLLTDLSPVTDMEDLANYMLRVNGLSKKFKLVAAALKEQLKAGVVPPAFALQKVAESCQAVHHEMTSAPEECALFTTALAKLEAAGFQFGSDEEKEVSKGYLLASIEKAAKAFHTLNEEVTKVLSEQPSQKLGVSDKGYYEWCIQEHSSLTASEVHHKGLDQVTMIEANINSCIDRLRANGRLPAAAHVENKPIAEYIRILGAEDRFRYEDSPEGKAALLQDFRKLVGEIKERSAHMFKHTPAAEIQVQQVASHMEVGAPAAFYMPGAFDGSRAGTFYVNTGDMSANPKFGMRTLTAHEAIPGHHFQISLAQESTGLPFFRRTSEGFTAYVEGWALYSERLAQELGFFATEPDGSEGFDLLGMLSDELLRAARLVVDTGIHHFDWTRAQAVNFMTQHTALAASDIETEVDRYCVLPGQAISYMLGQLELLELRSFAQEKQGSEFCLQSFHDTVLKGGAMPLQLLNRLVHAQYDGANSAVVEAPAAEVEEAPVHVIVQEKVDVEREEMLRREKEEAEKLSKEYPDLHQALRENGLMGQTNDGLQYMNYVIKFVERGITKAEQLKDVEMHVLAEIGLTPMEQRLYKKVFRK